MNKKLPAEKNCARCKKSFTCTSSLTCWCKDISTTPEQLKKLEQAYSGCLCKECLVEEIKNDQ